MDQQGLRPPADSAFLHVQQTKNENSDSISQQSEPLEQNWKKSRSSNTVYFEIDSAKIKTQPDPQLGDIENTEPVKNLGSGDGVLSVVSSVITADGIADVTSFNINLLIVFLGDMARGIFFPTMWNLVQTLGGDQVTLGYVIASFSFGRMLVLPLFGSWSTTYGYKWTLLVSTYILLFGTLLFTMVLNFKKQWFLVLANSIVGIGSGTLGVTLAYVGEVTPKRKRTGYIAYATAVQYAGTTVTPFIGSFFVFLLSGNDDADDYDDGNDYYDGDNYGDGQYSGFPTINEFTAPALFMTFVSCITLILIHKFFQDRPRITKVPPKKKSSRQRAYDEVANERTCFGYLNVYSTALYGCMILNAFTKGPMSCFETLGIEFAESRFDLHRAEAGALVASMGLLGAINLLAMGILWERYDDTELTLGGIVLFIIGILMNTTLDKDDIENNGKWRYVVSMFFSYTIGYPICHTALIGLFSKILGRKPQGTLQGWFSSSGSVARITFPILAGYIVMHKDIETLFYIISACLFSACLFLFAFHSFLTRLAS